LDAAYDFSDAFFQILEQRKEDVNVADLFAKKADSEKIERKDTSLFRDGGSIVPFGYDQDLCRKAFQTSPDSPVSEPIKGKDAIYVVCWLETKASELPALDGDDNLLKRVKRRMREERAIAKARKRAQEARNKLDKALAEGTSFDVAAKDVDFDTPEPFTRMRPPQKMSYSRDLLAAIGGTSQGCLLDAVETDNGAVLAYLDARTLAGDETYEAEKGRYEMQVRWTKRQAVLEAFYEELKKGSDTVLADSWGGEK